MGWLEGRTIGTLDRSFATGVHGILKSDELRITVSLRGPPTMELSKIRRSDEAVSWEVVRQRMPGGQLSSQGMDSMADRRQAWSVGRRDTGEDSS
jgi:hypothetical protein